MRIRNPKGKRKGSCKCGNMARKGQRYCNSCHAAYMRANRPRHVDLPEDQRKKSIARTYLKVYVRRGKVKKLPCEVCGESKVEAHHADYSKPLQVQWLCRTHHLALHSTKNDIVQNTGRNHCPEP